MAQHAVNAVLRHIRGGFTLCRLCLLALELDACTIESKFALDDCWIAWLQTVSGISSPAGWGWLAGLVGWLMVRAGWGYLGRTMLKVVIRKILVPSLGIT